MFTVTWVYQRERDPGQIEESLLTDIGELFGHCHGRLLGLNAQSERTAPTGFIICDRQNNVLRRSFDELPWLGRKAHNQTEVAPQSVEQIVSDVRDSNIPRQAHLSRKRPHRAR
jgi:hypothetical protein